MSYRIPQWTMLAVAVATLIVLALLIIGQLAPAAPPSGGAKPAVTTGVTSTVDNRFDTAEAFTEVSVIEATAGTYHASLEGYGAVSARYVLQLQSMVAGEVLHVSDQFENGELIDRGEVLLLIDPTSYEAAVADAETNLASARVSLLEEERSAEQAAIEWQEAGLSGEPESDLVLRKPQLASARAALAQAEKNLAVANRNLKQTNISLPFDGVVVTRDVGPGSYVQVGESLGEVFDRSRVEIRIALSAKDWASLPNESELLKGDWPVQLKSVDGEGVWTGYVSRVEHHVEEGSRQRHLMVTVDNPLAGDNPLYPGTFVQADIIGRSVNGLWQLPTSALSQQSEIWYLDSGNKLSKFQATPLFSDKGSIYVQPPLGLQVGSTRVLTQPLSSYLPGMLALAVTQQ